MIKEGMTATHKRPYGLWKSPITPHTLSGDIRLSDVQWDSDGHTLVWLEGRSSKGVLVCTSVKHPDAPRDLTVELSVRAQVGYGGGDFTVSGGVVFFVAKSGRIFRQPIHKDSARAITPEFGRAAAPTVAPHGRWVLYVHSYEGNDALAIVDSTGQQWPQRIVTGHDFFMQPRWHPDSKRIAYVAWDHPQMPWDGTMLFLSHVDEQNNSVIMTDSQMIAGSQEIAIFQPEFSPDGRWLSYISDESGWNNIYLYDLEQQTHHQLTHEEWDYGAPAWTQGLRTYGWCYDSQSLFVLRNEHGFGKMYRLRINDQHLEPITEFEPYSWISQPAPSPTTDCLAVIASSSICPTRLLVWEATTQEPNTRIMCRSSSEHVEPSRLAQAQPVTWQTTGTSHTQPSVIHGLLYLPVQGGNEEHKSIAQDGVLPPAIIRIHGGPTSQSVASFQHDVQFFTTRGYVVLTVNYRGSTGYGRAYMDALRGNWGVCDIEDAISAAHYLTREKIADSSKLVIMGGSAGGYTVLESMCRAPGVFKAGICLYGVSNLFALTIETHKFEERYLDSLLGVLPEAQDVYRERSPLFHAHLLNDSIAIFQGDEDTIVPRAQSDTIVESLKKRGVPHEYHIYAGEGHGFRKQETIESFYKAVESFLQHHVLLA